MQENFSKTNVKKYFKQIFFKTFGAKSFWKLNEQSFIQNF
jgi:hypothetical protein